MINTLYENSNFSFNFVVIDSKHHKYYITRISGPDGPLILAVDLRNPPKGGGYGRTHGPTHCFIYIDITLFGLFFELFS